MVVESLLARRGCTIGGDGQRFGGEFAVSGVFEIWGHNQRHLLRVDGNESEVEQSMQVGTEQKSVRGVVGNLAFVGADMCGLECLFGIAASDHAFATVEGQQLFAECGLALADDDIGFNTRSSIQEILGVESA